MATSNRFRLDSGRDVLLQQLFFRVSDEGFLEGNPEAITAHVLRHLPDTISRVLWKTEATLILRPPPGPLPAYTFIAHLISFDTVPGGTVPGLDEAGDYSRLIVAWFQDSLSGDLVTLVQSALRHIDWDSHAENWVD